MQYQTALVSDVRKLDDLRGRLVPARCTCISVATLIRQVVDGPQQFTLSKVLVQAELLPGVCAVLNHSNPCLVLSNVKCTSHGTNEAADVFEVLASNAPRAIH